MDTPLPWRLTGRKYLCEGCVKTAAKLVGLVEPAALAEAEARATFAEGELKNALAKITHLEAIHVETLRDLLKAAKKPAASKAAPASE